MIAVVGPLTSIAVGVVAVGLWFVTPDGLLRMAVEGLAGANLLVGVLNLVPGLPLDGGRVLKSVVWGATGNVHRGTIVAGWGGRLTAVAVLGWPVLQERVLGTAAGRPRLRPRLRRRRCSCGRARPRPWPRHGCGDGCPACGPRPRPAHPHRPGRPAARPRRYAAPRRPRPAASSPSPARPSQPASSTRPPLLATPEDRRPWVPVSTVARTLDEGLTLPVGIAARS